jgi:hypothetical protein
MVGRITDVVIGEDRQSHGAPACGNDVALLSTEQQKIHISLQNLATGCPVPYLPSE